MKKKYLVLLPVVLFSLTGCYNSDTVKGKWVEYNNPENTLVFSDSTATFTIDGEKSTFKYEGDKAITIYSPGETTEIHCIVEDDYEQLQCGQTIYVRETDSSQKDNEVNSSSSEKEEDSQKSLDEKLKEEADSISKDKQKSLKEITVTNYLNLLNSNTKSIIYISRPDCKYCKIQDPIIKNIYYENPKIPLYYINTNNMSSSDWDDLENSDEFFNSNWGTPTIIVIENGSIIDSFIGINSKDDIIDLLESNDFL